mgnify:CR=1 FL=1
MEPMIHGKLRTVAEILGARSPQEKWGVKTPVDYGTTGDRALDALMKRAIPNPERPGLMKLDDVLVRAGQELVHCAPTPECPKDRLIVRFVVVSGEPARDRKILNVPGINWRAYDENPVTMFCHQYDEPPVGRGLWRGIYKRGEKYEVWKDIEFMPGDLYPFGNIVGRMYAGGWMRGISGGWKGEDVKWILNRAGKPVGVHFVTSDYLEDSACPIPIDKYALSEAVQRGVLSTDARDVFASHAKWPELSRSVAYEITEKEVLAVPQRVDRTALARAVDPKAQRSLVEEKKLESDKMAFLRPEEARSEGADPGTGEGGDPPAGDPPAPGGETPAGDPPGEGGGATFTCPDCSAALEAEGAHEGCPGAGTGDESSPGGDAAARSVPSFGAPGEVLQRGEMSKALDVGHQLAKAGLMMAVEPLQELYYVCSTAYYDKRSLALRALESTPFMAPLLEAWGFQRGSADARVTTEHHVAFDPEKFSDHRACRAWLAENGFDDNTQITAMRAEDGKSAASFLAMQRDGRDFDPASLTNVEVQPGVIVTRGVLTPEAMERFRTERRAAATNDADEPWSVEMRLDRYLTLFESAIDMMGQGAAAMRDALDVASAGVETGEEATVIGQASVAALEDLGLDEELLADIRAGRIFSGANRAKLVAASKAINDLLAQKEKPDREATTVATEGSGLDQSEFAVMQSRLGAAVTTLETQQRAATSAASAEADAAMRSMTERFSKALPGSGGPAAAPSAPSAPSGGAAPRVAGTAPVRRAVGGGLPGVKLPGTPMISAEAVGALQARFAKVAGGAGTE